MPLINYGHLDFGENKVQEAIEKWSNVKNSKINLKLHMVGRLQTNKVKQVAIGQVAAENFELNDLKNVDTTTVTPSEGDTIVYDATTQKFEASAGIDGGFYGS